VVGAAAAGWVVVDGGVVGWAAAGLGAVAVMAVAAVMGMRCTHILLGLGASAMMLWLRSIR